MDRDDGRRPTRRTFLRAGLATGAVAWLGVPVAAQETIELGGETAGWVGRAPESIADETNPTLTLTAGETYQITWENVDGVPHNVVILDGNDEQLERTEIISEQGATQTLEFEATEEMAAYLCEVHPNTMRGDVEVEPAQEETPTPEDAGEETEAADEETEDGEEDEPGEPGFAEERIVEQRGDFAYVDVSLGDAGEATLELGSTAVNYRATATLVDGDGDGQVTVVVDTLRAGRAEESPLRAVGDADEVTDYERHTESLDDPLDSALYGLRLRIEDEQADFGTLVLEERETRSIAVGVVRAGAELASPAELGDAVVEREAVAVGDRVAIGIRATGLSTLLTEPASLTDEERGFSFVVEEVGAMNREPQRVDLSEARAVLAPRQDRYVVVVDTSALQADREYEARFEVSDANPYVPAGESEGVATTFGVVERGGSVDESDGAVRLPPAETDVTGTATVAPGTQLSVELRGGGSLLDGGSTTVADDGSWSVPVDLSDVEPGTGFTVRVLELGETARGVVAAE